MFNEYFNIFIPIFIVNSIQYLFKWINYDRIGEIYKKRRYICILNYLYPDR